MMVHYLCYKSTILIDITDLDESLTAFVDRHGPEGCRLYLEELRWPGGVECPRCESGDVHWLERRARYHCRDCRYQFRVTARTVFHDSHLSLSKWFLAVALMLSTAEGISAVELRRILGGSYKSAWFLEHRIRSAMGSQDVIPAVPVAYAAPVAERKVVRQAREALGRGEAPPGWPLLRSVIAGASWKRARQVPRRLLERGPMASRAPRQPERVPRHRPCATRLAVAAVRRAHGGLSRPESHDPEGR